MQTEIPIKLLILSNQTFYLDALISLFNTEYAHIESKGAKLSNNEYLKQIKVDKPAIVLLDANGMGKEIWEVLKTIHQSYPNTHVIMLANTNESIYLNYAKKFGARGYVLKSSPKEIIVAAIKIVSGNGYFFDPGIVTTVDEMERINYNNNYNLTKREVEVIMLITEGFTTKDISEHLQLSFHTVEAHRKNIYSKLKINKVAELIKLYSEVGRG